MLAISLDGRLAPPAGGPARFGGSGDRRVLEEALAWADGTLVGAETLRQHGSTCLIRQEDLLQRRRADGLPLQPPVLAVSRSRGFDPALPFFRQPVERWLVAPAPTSGDPHRCPAAGFSRQLLLHDWPTLLSGLAALDLRRLVLLGGARLASCLLAEGLVDELQLTLCPLLLGGGHSWLPGGGPLPAAAGWRLVESRPLGGGELLLRYGRAGGRVLRDSAIP